MHKLIRSAIPLLISLSTLHLSAAAPTPDWQNGPQSPQPKTEWQGWDHIDKLFVFGASYTGTGFSWLPPNLQPSPSNPLGNSVRGSTSSNGPNFITYLTTVFNASLIETYNFAFAGAQVSATATSNTPYAKDTGGQNDMVGQVNSFTSYCTSTAQAPLTTWSASSSLFISFFGINDILASYARADPSTTSRIFESYNQNLESLYLSGARNFLILNIPPMDLMPLFVSGFQAADLHIPITAGNSTLVRQAVEAFNGQIPTLVSNFESSHPDAKVFIYNVHALFYTMTASSSSANALTSQYGLQPLQNLQTACQYYTTPSADYLGQDDYVDGRCGGSVGTYFWLNGLHVTWPVHKVLAGGIVQQLKGN
ncbi:MAG: hypothetical protein Q9181_005204 [Wetmoreana brouardii]